MYDTNTWHENTLYWVCTVSKIHRKILSIYLKYFLKCTYFKILNIIAIVRFMRV